LRRKYVANKVWKEVAAARGMTHGISKWLACCIPKIDHSNTRVQSQHSMPAVPVFIVHLSNVCRFRGYEIMSAKFCKHVLLNEFKLFRISAPKFSETFRSSIIFIFWPGQR
jgi:hypothetical protein